MKKTGLGITRKLKNKRVGVFVQDDGTVVVRTKRLRQHPRESIIVQSQAAYSKDTFDHIISIYGEIFVKKNFPESEEKMQAGYSIDLVVKNHK